MMTLTPHFEHPRARNTDPITSWQAAGSAKELAKHHSQIILQCLKDYGPLGKDGISRFTNLESHQIGKRLPEMEREGLIGLTGNKVLSKTNRNEREWYAISEIF